MHLRLRLLKIREKKKGKCQTMDIKLTKTKKGQAYFQNLTTYLGFRVPGNVFPQRNVRKEASYLFLEGGGGA